MMLLERLFRAYYDSQVHQVDRGKTLVLLVSGSEEHISVSNFDPCEPQSSRYPSFSKVRLELMVVLSFPYRSHDGGYIFLRVPRSCLRDLDGLHHPYPWC